jgi:tungstate transport system substrate-binding protein
VEALARVARTGAAFVSRGDGSGPHLLEQALWRSVGTEPGGQPWYVESGSGMGQTLTIADQRAAYTLTDRATWLASRERLHLAPLVEGDPALLNVYHVMPVNPARFPQGRGNAAGGRAFADYLVGAAAQALIAAYGVDRFGEPLFVPDAGKPEDALIR